MAIFKTQIWEWSPSWDRRDVYIEADSAQEVIDMIKSNDKVIEIVDWGDCHETVYDDSADWKWEAVFDFEKDIEEVE